jgi:hypothetical protein
MPRHQTHAVPFSRARVKLGRIAALFVGAALVVTVGRAVAATPAGEETYRLYHQAIYAAAECEGLALYQHGPQDPNRTAAQAAHERMAAVISNKVNEPIATGRSLSLIDQAKRTAHDLIIGHGCSSGDVRALLALFHADLEPALRG